MPCYSPIAGWYSRELNDNGKRPIVFDMRDGFTDMAVSLPCGKCVGCLLDKSREWALRCMHESSLHEDNCFITLTYNDDNLPIDNSLNKSHFQKFFKRLRKKYGKGIRYLHCGEYGGITGRPHYHCAVFGWRPTDLVVHKSTSYGKLYESEILAQLWRKGFVTVTELTYETCAYVARYVVKKQEDDTDYGLLQKPYITMSNRPGIGYGWYAKYKTDVFPDDFIVHQNKKQKPPRYYIEKFGLTNKLEYAKVKLKRKIASLENPIDRERLDASEEVKKAAIKALKRKL